MKPNYNDVLRLGWHLYIGGDIFWGRGMHSVYKVSWCYVMAIVTKWCAYLLVVINPI